MTTTVTIDAHAGWPVKVEAIDKVYDQSKQEFTGEVQTTEIEVIPAGEVRQHAVWDTRQLLITELPPE